MRSLWNAFSLPATVLAIVVAVGAWLYVAIDQASFYGGLLWSTSARVPFFAFGLYIYFAVALNLAGSRFTWSRVGALLSWLILGLLVPIVLGSGFVLLYAAIGFFFPVLFRVPLQHGMAHHLAHITWLGFVVACLASTYAVSVSNLKGATRDKAVL
jgi:hypothetical protein